MRYFNDSGVSISNVVVSPGSCLPGGTFNLSFKITVASNATYGAINGKVVLTLGKGEIISSTDMSVVRGQILKTFTGITIAKGKSKNFSTTIQIPSASEIAWWEISPGGYISMDVEAYFSSALSDFYDLGVYEEIILLDQRTAPEISSYTLSDRAHMGNVPSESPLEYFGDILQAASLPCLTFNFALDPVNQNDPSLTANHQLVYTIGGVDMTLTATTGHGVGTVALNLNALQQNGTVNWVYTITDSYGNTDTETGSFSVIAYSPPAITNLLLERYAVVPDAGGESHEASDDGTHLWFTLDANVASVQGYGTNAWSAVMTYWETALGESTAVTVTSQDGWTLHGVDGYHMTLSRNETEMAGISVSDSKDYSFRLTITDAVGNSATLIFDGIVKAGAVLDVSPGGVGVGKRCTGMEGGGELFQCAYPASFDGNVAVGAGKLLKIEMINAMSSKSISANSWGTDSISASDVQTAIGSGWTPIGVVGIDMSGTGSTWCMLARFYVTTTSGLVVCVRNFSSSAASLTVKCYVLCIRTSL